jgi:hypothetical protein
MLKRRKDKNAILNRENVMKVSSKIRKIEEISTGLFTSEDKLQPPAEVFFEILNTLESVPNFKKYTILMTTITHLFEQKLSVLADEKKVTTDSSGLTVLHRLIKKNYPLPLLTTLLSQPAAKHIMLHHESTDSLITELQQYASQHKLSDPQHDPLINYLALFEQPWQSLMEKCNHYITSKYRLSSTPNLLKTLLTKFGNFPWDALPTGSGQLDPALFGYHLLTFFLCHSPASLEDIDNLAENKSSDFEKIRKNWLEKFPPVRIFETIFINFLLQNYREDVFARINFVLSRKIDSETTENEFINIIADNYSHLKTSDLVKIIKNILPYISHTQTLLYQLARLNFKRQGGLKDIMTEIKEGKEPFAISLQTAVKKVYTQLESYCQNPSFFSLLKASEKEDFIFLLISFKAPAHLLKQLSLNCSSEEKIHIEKTVKQITLQFISSENSTYLIEIFALFPPSYSNKIIDILKLKYDGALEADTRFAADIRVIITSIFLHEQTFPFEALIEKPENYYHCQSQTQIYLQEVKLLVTARVNLPTSLIGMIISYLSSENLINTLIKTIYPENFYRLKSNHLWNNIPIITYMAFTGNLITEITNAEHQLNELALAETKQKQREQQERGNIIADIMSSIEENKKQPLPNFFQAIADFNETDPTTILTMTWGREEKAVIVDDTAPVFQLKFLTNLINLTHRYGQGKTIAYPFLIRLNPTNFAVLILLCTKGIGQHFLATENITAVFPLVNEYIKKLLADDISALEHEFQLFTKANPISSFYKEEKPEMTPCLKALIDCWEALSKHKNLQYLVDLSECTKINAGITRPDLKNRMQKVVYNLTGSINSDQSHPASSSRTTQIRALFSTSPPHSTLFSTSPSYPTPQLSKSVRIDRGYRIK